jgi:signal transduction histidine kinase
VKHVKEEYAELLSLAVHEFRTPASVVGGYLRMLLRDTDEPLSDRHRRMVTEAEKSCARLVELVAELSEVAKLDRGTVMLNEECFDLFHVLEEVAANVQESKDRGVHLHIRGEASGAPIKGDLTRILFAFTSFFRAVLREQPAGRSVIAERRRVQKPGTGSAVVVIAPESDAMQAYESTPAAFIEKRGGLGLALPLARRVIERHGGRVWSPEVGHTVEGSTASGAIIVSLPLEEPPH